MKPRFHNIGMLMLFVFTMASTVGTFAQNSTLNSVKLGENSAQGVLKTVFSDINGDGNKDLVFATPRAIKWAENMGGAEFEMPIVLQNVAQNLISMDVGDLDNDGDEDIVWYISTIYRYNEVWFLENNGSGDFSDPQIILDQEDVRGIENVKIFAEEQGGPSFLYLTNSSQSSTLQRFAWNEGQLNTPDTLFTSQLGSYQAGAILQADLNSDIMTDIILYNYHGGVTQLNGLLSDGESGYDYQVLDETMNVAYKDLITVDVDNDDDLDLVSLMEGEIRDLEDDLYDYIYFYENLGDSFAERTLLDSVENLITSEPLYVHPSLSAFDINDDGYEDLLIARETNTWSKGKMLWLENQQGSGFSEVNEMGGIPNTDYDQLFTEDLNNDEVPELIAASSLSSRIDWFQQDDATSATLSPNRIIQPTITSPLDVISIDRMGSTKDVVVASRSPGNAITYFKNNGDLTFEDPILVDTSLSYNTQLFESDVNRDGFEDLLALTRKKRKASVNEYDYYYQIKWFENDRNGGFNTENIITQGFVRYEDLHFSIGDKDADNDDDMALLAFHESIDQQYLYTFENSGNGVFQTESYIFLSGYESIFFSDLHDGREGEELIVPSVISEQVGGRGGNLIYIIQYGVFDLDSITNSEVIETEDTVSTIVVSRDEMYARNLVTASGDINGDGKLDLVTGTQVRIDPQNPGTTRLFTSIREQDSNNYTSKVIDTKTSDFKNLSLADVDQDEDLDIIAELKQYTSPFVLDRLEQSFIVWYENQGNGEFVEQDTLNSGILNSGPLAMSDLTNDGIPEILSVGKLSGNVEIYKGSEIKMTTDVHERDSKNEFPEQISLSQNYPNPFNPSTMISYSLPRSSKVSIKVFNLLGQEVQTLVNDRRSAGNHQVQFDASSFASGIYIYRLKAGNTSMTRKMILVK